MTVVLHLSDTHRTPDEPVSNAEILISLKADIEAGWKLDRLPEPQVVIVTGDIVQGADKNEYDEAAQFLADLLDCLALPKSRLILLPGNHDVNWPASEAAFRIYNNLPKGVPHDLAFQIGLKFACPTDENSYQLRFSQFRDFYKSFLGEEYPTSRTRQFTLHEFADLGIAVAAFNSCDKNDHLRRVGVIHPDCILAASDALASFDGIRLAAWHHDLDWRNEGHQDCLAFPTLQQISQRVFDLALCGHTHRPSGHDVCHIADKPLPIVSAGSLCAGKRDRGDSVPRAYNIVELKTGGPARVHVRKKDERGGSWRADASYRDRQRNFVPHFDVQLARQSGVSARPDPLALREAKAPTPFRHTNARDMRRQEVVEGFVWTKAADIFDSNTRHVVLGPRGSGKTALLLTLTLEGRIASGRFIGHETSLLDRLGLMCPLSAKDVSAFSAKGWMPRTEREELFLAYVSTVWATELSRTLELAVSWSTNIGLKVPTAEDVLRILSNTTIGFKTDSHEDLRQSLRTMRNDIRRALGTIDIDERNLLLLEARKTSLFNGGLSVLNDLATELGHWDAFSQTTWVVLLDEVDNLNQWQQLVVYKLLGETFGSVSVKIATLPYGHTSSILHAVPPVVEGDDYRELSLSTPGHDGAPDSETESESFGIVVEQIWRRRLEAAELPVVPLKDIWVAEVYERVLATATDGSPIFRKSVQDLLLERLSPSMRERATALLEKNFRSFSDEYIRKYQQPFRFRLARELKQSGIEMPLYWGCSNLLKACDGNFRWFLLLADECWRLYWSKEGLRPLTAQEQDAALRRFSKAVARKVGSFGERSRELEEIVSRISAKLQSSLYDKTSISREVLQVAPSNIADEQAEAIAVGIAYGFVVPKMEPSVEDGEYTYPKQNIELRLGFPIAVQNELPLRRGATAQITDLRQVVFPWAQD